MKPFYDNLKDSAFWYELDDVKYFFSTELRRDNFIKGIKITAKRSLQG